MEFVTGTGIALQTGRARTDDRNSRENRPRDRRGPAAVMRRRWGERAYGSAAGKTAVGTSEGISRAESPTRYRSFYVSTAPSRYPLHISETYSTHNRRFIFVYSVVVGFFFFFFGV